MNQMLDEQQVQTALSKKHLPEAVRTYKLGEQVLVYFNEKKEWIGPFIVVDSTGER